MDQPRRSDADRNCVLGFGTASRLLVAWSSSLFLLFLMTKLSRFANGVVSVRPELKCTTPSLRFFSFRPNCPNALLLAARVRGARSHSRDTPHLNSACAVSKSARKPFVIKIEKQPASVALKGRAWWHEMAYG
jgi:hypothetical protein